MNSIQGTIQQRSRSLVVERVLPHPPEKLWRALTESSLLAQWMMNNDFEPVVGRKFQFRADPMPNWNGIVDCEVLVVDPHKCLSYNWGVGVRRRAAMEGAVDVDSRRRRHSRSHGAVRLPSRSTGSLSRRKVRLAEIHRKPRAVIRGVN